METDAITLTASSGSVVNGSKRARKKLKSDTNTTSTAVKALAKKRTKGKGKAGKLEGLMLLPMDVLFEVRL
jgi:hypothetical protein